MNEKRRARKFRWQTGLSTLLLLIGAIAVWLAVDDQFKENVRTEKELLILEQTNAEVDSVIEQVSQ